MNYSPCKINEAVALFMHAALRWKDNGVGAKSRLTILRTEGCLGPLSERVSTGSV